MGVQGADITSCTLDADGVLMAHSSSLRLSTLRYVFYDETGHWIGEQWVDRDAQTGVIRLLASQGSIERSDIHMMRCFAPSEDPLAACGPELHVDEGPDTSVMSLLISRTSITVQIRAFYVNFVSQADIKLHDQLYFVQLDNRDSIKPIVTDATTQLIALFFGNVKPGRHKISYGNFEDENSTDPRGVQRLSKTACFTIPATHSDFSAGA
jgi:hypothetical protein